MTTALPRPLPDPDFWSGRRVLVTGHTGFKGSWLTAWLRQLGATVMGMSLPDLPTDPALWTQLRLAGVADVRADVATTTWYADVVDFSPEVVLHLAAQPLVSVGYDEPARTFETNVLGTVRVLDLLPRTPGRVALIITTDKVYDPAQAAPHDEAHYFGGRDPYSASKAAAEVVVAGWPHTECLVATARAGNVIGGGDWAAHRLVPDLVRAWQEERLPTLRRPSAVRPWQHVLEPLRGYLLYVESLWAGRTAASGLNFGPADEQAVPVQQLAVHAAGEWRRLGGTVPDPGWHVATEPTFAETEELTLDSTLAGAELGWRSLLDWRTSVTMTVEWYQRVAAGEDAASLVAQQLAAYASIVGSDR